MSTTTLDEMGALMKREPREPRAEATEPGLGERLVKEARDEYLRVNQFDVGEYTAPTFRLKLLGRNVDLPNSPDRQRAIPLHDLHHVATGYRTDFIGEAEIGTWELVAGCRTPVVYFLNLAAALGGLFLSPRRVLGAFRAARGARSLYRQPLAYEQALKMTVSELRAHLGVPQGGMGAVGAAGATGE